ncbi:MAG: hypothetical protein GXP49_11025 [Deltaproteobacteria bacterium]|nr:hypothetical protein [Deltaproteobacteria bacterium]
MPTERVSQPMKDSVKREVNRISLPVAASLTRHEMNIQNEWVSFVGEPVGVAAAIRETISNMLSTDVELLFGSPVLHGPALGGGEESVVCFPVGMGNENRLIHLSVDTPFATFIVDSLLGGKGGHYEVQRPLTGVERGALSAVLLNVMRKLEELGLPCTRLLSLGGPEPGDLDKAGLMVPIVVKTGNRKGHVRLYLPDESPGTEGIQGRSIQKGINTSTANGLAPAVELELAAQIGWGTLPLSHLVEMGPGDLVLFDELTMAGDGKGSARLVAGHGEGKKALVCAVLEPKARDYPDGKNPRLQVVELLEKEGLTVEEHSHEELVENKKTAEATRIDDLNSPGARLLDDLPVKMTLELGRIVLTAREIMALRPGNILELDKNPEDLLELTVNGRTIALCELVEVDGRFGARVNRLVAGD